MRAMGCSKRTSREEGRRCQVRCKGTEKEACIPVEAEGTVSDAMVSVTIHVAQAFEQRGDGIVLLSRRPARPRLGLARWRHGSRQPRGALATAVRSRIQLCYGGASKSFI